MNWALKFGIISTAVGALAFGLLWVPPFGPMGPCATGSQSLLLFAGLSSTPLGLIVLLIYAGLQIRKHVRGSKKIPTILN